MRRAWAGRGRRRGRTAAIIVTALAVVIAGPATAAPAAAATAAVAPGAAPPGPAPPEAARKIQSTLREALRDQGEAPFWVRLADRADLTRAGQVSDWAQRGRAVHDALTATARASQAKARAVLDAAGADYTPFWVSNAIYVRGGSLALAQALATDARVAALLPARSYELPEPAPARPRAEVGTVEWGVAAINADDVWSRFGDTGSGIVVANIDTGAQFTHPALVRQYRGSRGDGFEHDYNWFDPSRVCPSQAPCDNHGHGTHTMGTMVGDDQAGNQVGVAPGARWIAAKGCETTECSEFALVASGQWMVAPTDLAGQNPRPDLRPQVVNNSWSEDDGPVESPFYDDVLRAWRAAGIFPAFANGNEGPGCDTVGGPGDSLLAYSVGAFDAAGRIASFSSRGPGAEGTAKPNVAAPGVAVRSSVPTDGYAAFNGTSMATPHLAATVALMWSAAPELVGDVAATETILDRTAADADDTSCGGTAADNNVFGEGRLDALAAVQASPRGPAGILRGVVADADSGEPVASALVSAVSSATTRSGTSGEDGAWSLELPPGDYTVSARAFGYRAASATATVTEGQATTVQLLLAALPAHLLKGKVVEQGTRRPVAGARLTLAGTPRSVTTDAAGRYSFGAVPDGEYDLAVTSAEADNCFAGTERRIKVRRTTIKRLELGHARDAYGYSCRYERAGYVEADSVVTFPADRLGVPVELPFTIDLYQRSYRTGTVFVSRFGDIKLNETGNPFDPASGRITVASATVAPFATGWLRLVEGSRVATRTAGKAPNRTFTVEWRNMGHARNPAFSVDFEVTFHEHGEIVFAYRDIEPEVRFEAGSDAWTWISAPAATLNRFFLFASQDEAALGDSRRIRYTLPANGLVTGTVRDAGDRRPIAGAPVRILDGSGERVLFHLFTDAAGRYRARLFRGDYTVTALAHGYTPRTIRIRVRRDGQVAVADAALATGVIGTDRDRLAIHLGGDGRGHATLTLTNRGRANLAWRATEIAGPPPPGRPGERLGEFSTGTTIAAGVAVAGDGNLWVSSLDLFPALAYRLREYRPDGSPTGRAIDPVARWGLAPTVALNDLAAVPAAGLMCAVGHPEGANHDATIYCFDPATGDLERTLDLAELSHEASGLAYDAAGDRFYVTGSGGGPVFTGGVTAVAGPLHARPGATLARCAVDLQPGGAAFNPTSRTLWVTRDRNPYTEAGSGWWIEQLDPRTCVRVSRFHDDDGDWSIALDVDAEGNLWKGGGLAGPQLPWKVFHVASGDPVEADASWLELSRTAGVLAPGESTTITVRATRPVGGGPAAATLRLLGNAGRAWDVRVPVTTS